MQKRGGKSSLVHTWIYSVSSLKSPTPTTPLTHANSSLFCIIQPETWSPFQYWKVRAFFFFPQPGAKCIECFELEKYFKLILMKTHFIVGTDRFVVLLFCCHGNQGAAKPWYSNVCHLWYLPSPNPLPLSNGDGDITRGSLSWEWLYRVWGGGGAGGGRGGKGGGRGTGRNIQNRSGVQEDPYSGVWQSHANPSL